MHGSSGAWAGHGYHPRQPIATTFKGEANAYLSDPTYNARRHRLEISHAAVEAAAVEARRRVRLNEGR